LIIYDNGTVLFKPTLTFGDQTFRLDKEGAAAYFIGGNPKYPNDTGFALCYSGVSYIIRRIAEMPNLR
jgi:hypothetical protein